MFLSAAFISRDNLCTSALQLSMRSRTCLLKYKQILQYTLSTPNGSTFWMGTAPLQTSTARTDLPQCFLTPSLDGLGIVQYFCCHSKVLVIQGHISDFFIICRIQKRKNRFLLLKRYFSCWQLSSSWEVLQLWWCIIEKSILRLITIKKGKVFY